MMSRIDSSKDLTLTRGTYIHCHTTSRYKQTSEDTHVPEAGFRGTTKVGEEGQTVDAVFGSKGRRSEIPPANTKRGGPMTRNTQSPQDPAEGFIVLDSGAHATSSPRPAKDLSVPRRPRLPQ